MKWKNVYRGLAMGASDVVPGVSGGTIAVLLGIYDELISALNGLFSRDWKKHLSFLIPLALGIILSIFTLAKLMDWLLIHYPKPTYFMFLGLIIGVLPYLFKKFDVKRNFLKQHYVILLVGLLLIVSLTFFQENTETLITGRTFSIYLLFFLSGFIGSAAMILPGISGSFILLMIGVYPSVIHAISHFQFDIILITGLGIGAGIIFMSKLIHYFLSHFEAATFAAILGMVIGSIFVIYPGMPIHSKEAFVSILMFALGLFIAYIFGKIEHENVSQF